MVPGGRPPDTRPRHLRLLPEGVDRRPPWLTVRLPSGAEREGTVFFRGIDADYATQRDVSRTKRNIRTFEIRLRCDNRDRGLAVGMTAYVTLPLSHR